jgi:hypothetical protein
MPDTKFHKVYEYRIRNYKDHIIDWINNRGTVFYVNDIDVVYVDSKKVDILYISNLITQNEESIRHSVLHTFSNTIHLVDWSFLMYNKHILLILKRYYDKKHNKDLHK